MFERAMYSDIFPIVSEASEENIKWKDKVKEEKKIFL